MKVVIIGDEKKIANDLALLISKIRPAYEVITILHSVKSAIEFFRHNKICNLVFSAMQLPDGLGFEIFRDKKIKTPVIYYANCDAYALQAFEANGIAYIVKPFQMGAIQSAIEKFEAFTIRANHLFYTTEQYGEKTTKEYCVSAVLLRYKNKIIPVKLKDIALVHLNNRVVKLLTFDKKIMVSSESLEYFDKIGNHAFFRVNRQFLINRNAVCHAEHYFKRKLLVHLSVTYPEQIIVSKEKATEFLQWLVNS